MDRIAKMALTVDELRQALAEYVCRKRGIDPKILNRAGVGLSAEMIGQGEDLITVVTIDQK